MPAACFRVFLRGHVGGEAEGLGRFQAAHRTDAFFVDPIVENGLRVPFSLWVGTGVRFIRSGREQERSIPAVFALLSVIGLGGLGCVLSIWQHGLPHQPFGVAFGAPGLLAENVVPSVVSSWVVMRHRPAR